MTGDEWVEGAGPTPIDDERRGGRLNRRTHELRDQHCRFVGGIAVLLSVVAVFGVLLGLVCLWTLFTEMLTRP